MRPTVGVDCKGRRGKWAQFRAATPLPAGQDKELVELRNVGTGFWLSNDPAKPCASVATSVKVQQVQPPSTVTINSNAKKARRREEAKLYVQERRQEATYALQSAEA